MPADTLAPLLLACGPVRAGFVGALLARLVGGGARRGHRRRGALMDWFWPRRVHADMEAADG